MKSFKKLRAYKKEEAEDTIFGFGMLRARDYDTGKLGHLILFSLNIGSLCFIKKAFIPL